jgi:hypothetical protein
VYERATSSTSSAWKKREVLRGNHRVNVKKAQSEHEGKYNYRMMKGK